jgi:acyl carrier protein
VNQHGQFGFEDLKQILVERVGVPAEDITEDLSATFDHLGLDSLALIDVQLAVEEEYGFQIEDHEAARIHTVGDAIDLINEHLAALSEAA